MFKMGNWFRLIRGFFGFCLISIIILRGEKFVVVRDVKDGKLKVWICLFVVVKFL